MKFQIGDRVRCLVDSGGDVFYGGPRIGQVGTLVTFRPGRTLVYGVEFDDRFRTGHDLSCTGTKKETRSTDSIQASKTAAGTLCPNGFRCQFFASKIGENADSHRRLP